MFKTITFNSFTDAFRDYNRQDQFSYEALRAIFEYLEDYEDGCDNQMELDVIAICCEFTEYEDLEDLQTNYSDIESLEDLYNHTTVIELDNGGLVIVDY